MENIKAAFEKIKIKKCACDKGDRFFDPIRKSFVFITPEELVRQRMIQFLINDMAVPTANIRVEDHLTHFGVKNSNRRIDIALTYFDKDSYERPLAVIECKKEDVSIEAGQVLEQAYDYATAIGCRYFIVVNGNTDEMSVQINMNRFLSADKCRNIHLTHNGAVTRKGASKSDFLAFLRERTDNLVKNNQIDFGYADCSKSLTLQNEDVIFLISRLIEYSVYRNEYKKKFSG